MTTDDLELKALDQFCGTENYYRMYSVNITDGIKYICDNGYHWFVSDSLIRAIDLAKDNQPFIAIKLEVNLEKKTADVIFTDGNDHELDRTHYTFTSAKRNVTLYFIDDTLILSGEY